MTIILFLVDTSASMSQKAYVNGVQKTYLDIAKGAVETFLKYRQRTQDCLGDRYMLLTFEEPPANVKAGWKENHATFINELKNLQCYGLTTMGESLKNAFDLLNLNRMQSGIDTYGQGRCPFYLEPSVIIVITDGGRYSFRNGVHQEIILPLNTQIPGTKFTKEPFRWDQRLFSLVLRMPGNKIDERVEGKVPHDDSPIERMCEVTGGRSYRVKSHYVLNQCIESLVQKVQPGVVLQFEPMIPKDPKDNSDITDIAFQATKKMIYVQKHISQKTFPMGYWPLPEPYWTDPKAITLPPRDAHPKLRILTPAVDEPQMVRSFPVDKYEIEASPLTLQILSKREINKCWPVIIANGIHGFEAPFGYLKASPNFSQVHLYVLAYNYPALLPILHDLIHKYNMSPPNELMYKFNAYVRSIPPYYCPFLRKALVNISVPYPLLQFLLPENVDNYLSPNIANQLKHIKNTAKQEQENLCQKVHKQLKQPKPPYRQIETAKLNPGQPVRRDLIRNPLLRDTFSKLHAEIEPLENYTIVVPALTRQPSAKNYRNPFDIPRRDLIDEITRMHDAFLRSGSSLVSKDSGHCLPISEMGNYQEYLKNKDNPLREIEPTNVRQHMFGNPYKKDKHMVMVDEADLSDVAPIKSNASNTPKKLDPSRSRKRKAGPIRRDFVFRRTSIDLRPCMPTSSQSSSDFEGESGSDTSTNASEDGDPDRLTAFDFNEPTEEFPINGHVRNFINGITDDACDDSQSSVSNLTHTESIALSSATSTSMQALQNNILASTSSSISILNAQTFGCGSINNTSLCATTVTTNTNGIFNCSSSTNNNSNSISNQLPNIAYSPLLLPDIAVPSTSLSAVNKAPTSSMVAAMLPPITFNNVQHINGNITNTSTTIHPTPAFQQNDINDAQEISRILQQCHNGNSDVKSDELIIKTEPTILSYDSSLASATLSSQALNYNFDNLKKSDSTVNVASTSNSNQYHRPLTLSPPQPKNSVSPTLSIEYPLSNEQRETMRKHNLEMRTQIFKDIRRPGRDYTQLLDNLCHIKGDNEMKTNFIQMCVNESMRFRRKKMASSIQEWWDKKQEVEPHVSTSS